MHSFVSLSLLSILSFSFQLLHSSALSGFLISSGSLLEILCLFILFTSSVSILIINAWNSLSGKLFIFVLLVSSPPPPPQPPEVFLVLSFETNSYLILLTLSLCTGSVASVVSDSLRPYGL